MDRIVGSLRRVGVFYDGNFFSHISNYYRYQHDRQARISVKGLHKFIRHEVSDAEGVDARFVQIVDAHYFRGRQRAQDAQASGTLLGERAFDDVLTREGVVTHYLPLGPQGEKGIDVWLALESYELAIYKRFDVCVLIAGDGDFLPLVRKLNTLGTRIMLLGWDFSYVDQNGRGHETRTAQTLIEEVSYPIMMSTIIDDRSRRHDTIANELFLTPRRETPAGRGGDGPFREEQTRGRVERLRGVIQQLESDKGWGRIQQDTGAGDLLFFHRSAPFGIHFNDLSEGQRVSYSVGSNDRGPCALEVATVPPDEVGPHD